MKWQQEFEMAQVGASKRVKQFAWYPVVVGMKNVGNKRIYTWAWLTNYTAVYSYMKLERNFTGLPRMYYAWVFQYGEPI